MSRLRRVTIPGLAQMTGTTESRLHMLASCPAAHYLRRTHCGKNGKKRVLTIPNRELKGVQRCLLRKLLDPLGAAHKAAACVRGKGAVWMMRRHQRHPFLLSLDIRNFFPSVTRSRVSAGLTRLGLQHAELLSSLLTVNNELPQGAPTSVALGDIVLFPLDRRIAGLAKAEGLVYSRYVDDLVISGGSRIRRFQQVIARYADEERWKLNQKGGLFGPGDRHMVLGAVVNAKPNVSERYSDDVRFYLRHIERGRMRPTSEELNRLASRVAWISHVNPDREPQLEALLKKAIDATGSN